jgi:site-specific DNA-methyltransferase (adenine-specific)
VLIHAGDCIEWLEAMADGSADHCITDPPYSDHVHAKSLRSNTRTSKAKRRVKTEPSKRELGFVSLTPALQRDVACELARVTKRWVMVFCNVELVSPWMFALQGAGLDYVRTMPWCKPNSAPQFTGDRPAAAWECIVLAHRKGKKRWNSGGKRGYYVEPIEHHDRVHATEKPVRLMTELVLDFTEPGDLIIDPFAGGGTTGLAALRHGRRFEGAELDPAMALTAAERLTAEQEGSTLSARRAGQLSILGSLDRDRDGHRDPCPPGAP